ncbi:MAG TPA: hypothetical protein VNJ02_17020 [Vicinamibacterales bacterium]|nr:hypothetical protein [Vicinamibacterales bacterium]
MRAEKAVRQLTVAEKHERRKPVDWSDAALKPVHAERARLKGRELLAAPTELVGSTHTELVAAEDPDERQSQERLQLRETLNNPDVIGIDASEQRADVATRAGVLSPALDASTSVGATNSLERMMCHQMAAAHMHGMETLARVHQDPDLPASDHARLLTASAKLFDAFNAAALTLLKIRTGGKQHVVVQHQHVNVAAGGKAVVANAIRQGSREGGVTQDDE